MHFKSDGFQYLCFGATEVRRSNAVPLCFGIVFGNLYILARGTAEFLFKHF